MAKKSQRASETSSGLRNVRKANYELRRLKMKVKRWERRQDEISKGKRPGDLERWNTAGLLKRMSQLHAIAK